MDEVNGSLFYGIWIIQCLFHPFRRKQRISFNLVTQNLKPVVVGLIKFFNRHKLSLWSHTLVSQKLPSQLESVLTKCYANTAKFVRIGKYPLSLVGNMYKTPAFFHMVPSKWIAAKGTKECVDSISGGKKNILMLFWHLWEMRKCSHQWLFSREKLIELSATLTFLLRSSWNLKKKHGWTMT